MTSATQAVPQTDFIYAFQGSFKGILRWDQLDSLWQRIRENPDIWYVYAVGELPPETVATPVQLNQFITEIDSLLRRDHDEDYCGIVYADDREQPEIIKIFDPNNLGSSCGNSGKLILPGWILSRSQPTDLPAALKPPNNRRRWWQQLFPAHA